MVRVTERVLSEFEELCCLEPRLAALKSRAAKAQASTWEEAWYGKHGNKNAFRFQVRALVGMSAGYQNTCEAQPAENQGFRALKVSDILSRFQEIQPEPGFPEQLRSVRAYDVAYSVILAEVRRAVKRSRPAPQRTSCLVRKSVTY